MLWQFEFDIFDLGVLMYNKSLCFLRKNMFFEEEEERRTKYWRVSIGEWRSSEDRGNIGKLETVKILLRYSWYPRKRKYKRVMQRPGILDGKKTRVWPEKLHFFQEKMPLSDLIFLMEIILLTCHS